jgi:hypothetical protein
MLCFFFPAAPIQDSCRETNRPAVVLVFSQFLLRAEKEILLQQKTLEANAAENSEEKKSVMCTMNGKTKKKYTNVQKSHFTFTCCLPPFHLTFFYFNTRSALSLARDRSCSLRKKSFSRCKPDQNVKDRRRHTVVVAGLDGRGS